MQMYDKVELYATIVVPENMLSLCCASDDIDTDVPLVPYRGDSLPESMHPYNLWEQNPKAVRSMVKAVKSATDNQIIIDSTPKNDDMEIIVDAYNEEHPDDSPIKMEDIVRLLGVANYAVSYPATDSKYVGSDLHEFTHIVYDGLTEYMKEVTIYVKIVTPSGNDPIHVLATHPNVARKDEVAKSKIGNVLHKSKQILEKAGKLPKK